MGRIGGDGELQLLTSTNFDAVAGMDVVAGTGVRIEEGAACCVDLRVKRH